MSSLLGRRMAVVLQTLPNVFMLQPTTNYQSLISHSTLELSKKTWELTARQMKSAMTNAESKTKNARKISQTK